MTADRMGVGASLGAGCLIVNADDWGRDRRTTDMTLDCVLHQTVSAVSAMVYMEDSERAAEKAREHGIDAGLHLNFTTEFSASGCPGALKDHQLRLKKYLCGNRFAKVMYHPGLSNSFEYVTKVQYDEYQRIYGSRPSRTDGHHHMHLCANVMFGQLIPPGSWVRRNESFATGERSLLNRGYRMVLDRILARRHRLVDFLLQLPRPGESDRLDRIVLLAQTSIVEVETHPVNIEEYVFLTGGGLREATERSPIARAFPSTPPRS